MSFELIWSDFAEKQLDIIFNYYNDTVNFKTANKIIQAIISDANKLLKNQEIGQPEILLLNRESNYRYMLCKNYKIIYSIDHNQSLIKIADVFDTRQNPNKIARNKHK